jgi:flavin-binding protein dodecin
VNLQYRRDGGARKRPGPKPKSPEDRFWSKVDRRGPADCWNWIAGRIPDGYGQFRLNNPRRQVGAHRFSYELHYGPIPEGLLVLHSCDNPSCVNPNHLSAGTTRDNSRDAIERGRNYPGFREEFRKYPEKIRRAEQHPMRKLDWQKVREIRALISEGKLSRRQIAARYGVAPDTVHKIAVRRTWREDPSEERETSGDRPARRDDMQPGDPRLPDAE